MWKYISLIEHRARSMSVKISPNVRLKRALCFGYISRRILRVHCEVLVFISVFHASMPWEPNVSRIKSNLLFYPQTFAPRCGCVSQVEDTQGMTYPNPVGEHECSSIFVLTLKYDSTGRIQFEVLTTLSLKFKGF